MNFLHLGLMILCLVGALKQTQTYDVFVIILDRETNTPLQAEVWLDAEQSRTNLSGKATFLSVNGGIHRLQIIPDDDTYVIGNGHVKAPQMEPMVIRMTKRP